MKASVLSILPIVALGMSLVSLYISETARRDVARIDVIKTEYGLFQDLAKLQVDHPLMTHLFASSEQTYDEAIASIKAAALAHSREAIAQLRLEEHGITHFIFVAYEQTFYVSRETSAGDGRRATLASDDLLYFDDLVCNNPRLRWYWTEGRLGTAFGEELNTHFDDVTKDCATRSDPLGPLVYERKDAHGP